MRSSPGSMAKRSRNGASGSAASRSRASSRVTATARPRRSRLAAVPLGVELVEEGVAPLLLVRLADDGSHPAEAVEGPQEAAVGLVAPPDVARAAPSVGAQRVEAAVVADAEA